MRNPIRAVCCGLALYFVAVFIASRPFDIEPAVDLVDSGNSTEAAISFPPPPSLPVLKQSRKKERPRCLALYQLHGGLGNQMFAVCAVLARAAQLHMTPILPIRQQISIGAVNSPLYFGPSGMFSHLGSLLKANPRACLPGKSITLQQFEPLPAQLPPNGSLIVRGMLMSYREVYANRKMLREIMLQPTAKEFRREYAGRNLVIGYK